MPCSQSEKNNKIHINSRLTSGRKYDALLVRISVEDLASLAKAHWNENREIFRSFVHLSMSYEITQN